MKPLQLILISLLFPALSQFCLHAQENTNKLSLEKGTIANRFDYVIKESTPYEDSKVVKTWWLTRLKSHVSDTIKGLTNQIQQAENLIAKKDTQIDSLKLALQNIESALSTVKKEKNSISLFGTQVSKKAYKSIIGFVIFILALLLLVFIFLYKRSNIITRQTNISLAELREEYDAHRKRAREREEKMSFDFHREINKLKEKKNL